MESAQSGSVLVSSDRSTSTSSSPSSGFPRPARPWRAVRFAQYGGGKGANQAVAAARLGAAVAFVGAVGGDEMGAEAIGRVARRGHRRDGSRAWAAPTGVALIVVDRRARTRSRSPPGANARSQPVGFVDSALAADSAASAAPVELDGQARIPPISRSATTPSSPARAMHASTA